jgi:CRISPR system Cascade subunit CasA
VRKLATVSPAFNIDEFGGPNFMQDFENFDGEELPIEDLVGGAISDNTREKNQDLFTKRNIIRQVRPYWASIELFNVQITGVLAWGKHRIGCGVMGSLRRLFCQAMILQLFGKNFGSTF